MCSQLESITPDIWLLNPQHNLTIIENNLSQIPEIGTKPNHSLRNGQIVRFRGMIQDMADPVLYLNQYEVVNNKTGLKELRCGKFKDVLNLEDYEMIDDNSPQLKHCERRSVYCVSVPGLSPWARPCQISSWSEAFSHDNMEVCPETSNKIKRNADEMEQEDGSIAATSETNKKIQINDKKDDKKVKILLNHPIENNNNYSCLINVYEDIDESLIKMNAVVDVVGFLSFSSDCDDFAYLPASLVPRLHAVSLKLVSQRNPFIATNLDENTIISRVRGTRDYLMNALKTLFLGDSLAAEYILCNLISKIYHRNELMTLGNFSVNLTKIPAENNYSKELSNTLRSLVPKSHYLPMTLENINLESYVPRKDYEHNCLRSGILQLSDHTHLFIDETKMEPGQLNSNGIANLKALKQLVKSQKLDYNFKYANVEIPADIPIVVLSEGKSLMSTSVEVILSPEACQGNVGECLSSVEEMLNEPYLTDIRNYLNVVSRLEFNLADDVIETIQNDYVKLRQEERKVNESDLHVLLILARLISLSLGQTSLTKETWQTAFEMELFRKARINNREP